MITENLSTLKIHKLTKEQYERELANGNIDESALYLTPEEEIDLSGYATVEQMNGKADLNHIHTISDVTDLQTTLDTMGNDISGKANSTHTHIISDVTNLESVLNTNLETAKSYTDTKTANLDLNKADKTQVTTDIDAAKQEAINSAVATAASDANAKLTESKAYTDNTVNAVKNDLLNGAGEAYDTLKELGDLINDNTDAIDALEIIATSKADAEHIHNASDITSGTLSSDRLPTVPITKGGTGATTAAGALTNLGITATATELNYVDGVTSNIQTQLNGKAPLIHNHSALSITTDILSSDRLPTVPISKGGTGATTAASALTNLGITATASELNKLDGITATTDELNYVDGVTSNIQSQLDGKAASSHTHTIANVTDLQSALDGKSSTSHTHSYAGSPSIGGGANTLAIFDTRDVNDTPTEITNLIGGKGARLDFKTARTVGLNNGTYAAVLSISPWEDTTYWSGGKNTQLGFCDDGKIQVRKGNGSGWTDWTTLIDSSTMDGVTSNIQTQLDGKAGSSHTHTIANVDGLQTALYKKLTAIYGTGTSSTNRPYAYGSGFAWLGDTIGIPGQADNYYCVVDSENNLHIGSQVNGAENPTWCKAITTNNIGSQSVNYATSAGSATQDGNGNIITSTYATKSDIPDYITTGAKSGTTIGLYATAEGYMTTASEESSHAEGFETTASNYASHAEGNTTTASGSSSHAEGSTTIASGSSSHAEGHGTIAKGSYSHAGGFFTIANNYQYVVGRCNADTTAPASLTDTTSSTGLFIVGIGSTSARSNGFRINPAGKVYGTGTFGTSGADYAEYFEWFDGNPNNEDRRGRFVTLEGDKIRYATPNDDYILGVVSADPSVAGDIHSEDWHNRYLKDVFGSKIVEVVEVEETTNEDGEIIPAHTERRWVLNPDYNPNVKYTSREERPEWDAIGIVGKLVVVDDGTCQVNGYCYPNTDGIATISQEKTNYRVMERLDDTHIRIFIR